MFWAKIELPYKFNIKISLSNYGTMKTEFTFW